MSSPLAASTIDGMQSVGFAVRLLPGQAEAHRIALASCWSGARKEAYQDARRRAGIIREAVWIQPGPGGDVAVVYLEADDLATAFTIVGTSAEPFDVTGHPAMSVPVGDSESSPGGHDARGSPLGRRNDSAGRSCFRKEPMTV